MNMVALLNKQFLISIGVELDEQTYQALSEHYEETLHERVLSEIIEELDEPQLEELRLLRDSDASVLQAWLTNNVPQLTEIIEDEVAILLGEVAESADDI